MTSESSGPQSPEATEGLAEYVYPNSIQDTRQQIILDTKDLRDLTTKAYIALLLGNRPKPTAFQQGPHLVRLRTDTERPFLEPLSRNRLRHHMAEIAEWLVPKANGELKPVAPPKDIIDNLAARPGWSVPKVRRIVTAPVLSPSGEVQTDPGYHEENQVLYLPPPGFELQALSLRPTGEEIGEARRLLVEEMFADFPFEGDADLALAIAAVVLPFVRDLIDGPTPLHLFDAPAPGTGKTLLAVTIGLVAQGRMPAAETQAHHQEEWRKKIGAVLSTGPMVVFFDNLRGKLDSPHVAAVLTSDEWADRRLGKNDEVIRYPNRAAWIATANNVTLSKELTRRTVLSRLDAEMERPYDRDPTRFKHYPLMGWVKAHRQALVGAALTLGLGWIQAGRPPGKASMGSYESWAEVIGGILAVAGIDGFLDNLAEFRSRSDIETEGWNALSSVWWESYGDESVAASQLLPLLDGLPDFLDLGRGGDRSRLTALGHRLVEKEDAVIGTFRIARGHDRQGSRRWKLVQLSSR